MLPKTKKPTVPYLKKIRGIMDMFTGDWTYEFEFVRQDGRKGLAIVPGDEADMPRGLARRLNKKGARLPRASKDRAEFLEKVIQAPPDKIGTPPRNTQAA